MHFYVHYSVPTSVYIYKKGRIGTDGVRALLQANKEMNKRLQQACINKKKHVFLQLPSSIPVVFAIFIRANEILPGRLPGGEEMTAP